MVRGIETAKFFFFFYNKRMAYYVPKRALDSRQIDEVRDLMRQGLGDRAILRETYVPLRV
jgi:hypothetical protein